MKYKITIPVSLVIFMVLAGLLYFLSQKNELITISCIGPVNKDLPTISVPNAYQSINVTSDPCIINYSKEEILDESNYGQRGYTEEHYTFISVSPPEDILRFYRQNLPNQNWSYLCDPIALNGGEFNGIDDCIVFGGPFKINFKAHAIFGFNSRQTHLNILLTTRGHETIVDLVILRVTYVMYE